MTRRQSLLDVRAALAAALLLAACNGAPAEPVALALEAPVDGAQVTMQETVRGTSSDVDATIRVLVHPMPTDLWWVQRAPSPTNSDGSWKTTVYFGTTTEGIGDDFEIIAIVPERDLVEGDTFAEVPPHHARSDVVTVTRTR